MDLEVCRKCNDCDYIVKCFGYIIDNVIYYLYFKISEREQRNYSEVLTKGWKEGLKIF